MMLPTKTKSLMRRLGAVIALLSFLAATTEAAIDSVHFHAGDGVTSIVIEQGTETPQYREHRCEHCLHSVPTGLGQAPGQGPHPRGGAVRVGDASFPSESRQESPPKRPPKR